MEILFMKLPKLAMLHKTKKKNGPAAKCNVTHNMCIAVLCIAGPSAPTVFGC